MRTKGEKKGPILKEKKMWWWLVLLSVCHRLPSSGQGDSTSSYSDCLHWCEDPPHLLVAIPWKRTWQEIVFCSLSLPSGCWVDSPCCCCWWFGQEHQSQPSQFSITNWGPALPRNPWVFGTRLWLLKYPASRAKQILSCCFLRGQIITMGVVCVRATQPQRLSNYRVLHLQLLLLF